MSRCHDEYQQWPFLSQEEFELACAFFDQRYVRASLGPTRQIFKIRSRRTLTAGTSYIEVLRILQLPEDGDELSLALAGLGKSGGDIDLVNSTDVDMTEEDGDEPYVTYEIHLHPTYRMPTLWFMLHDLPMGENSFNVDAVYRYLVPPEYKSRLRAAGVTGGISAAPHPITDVPAFFIHPCQTKEAMENFDCPIKNYLMIWIGLVGGCVGLSIPPEMARDEEEI
ncbi:autophagy-related protein-like protein Atg10 [Hyaloscypha hepaticicola]|uniref:Ubiquitin-like-conjugating enzyme ATG10 n=1 Tax=Hyaloscypha hepaticicola TaxID=2082293 RepID=A0A2J6QEW3_9HELO|nr:autophagy-related protein-like protein Atg10 [Hyaloscypha hepaticicola]